jgi:hypothetical protein
MQAKKATLFGKLKKEVILDPLLSRLGLDLSLPSFECFVGEQKIKLIIREHWW